MCSVCVRLCLFLSYVQLTLAVYLNSFHVAKWIYLRYAFSPSPSKNLATISTTLTSRISIPRLLLAILLVSENLVSLSLTPILININIF